jgi:hypothetical protein
MLKKITYEKSQRAITINLCKKRVTVLTLSFEVSS